MTHHILITKSDAILATTGLLNFVAMLTSEQISTWFQFGTMLGIVVIAFMNRMDSRILKQTADTTDKIHTLSNSSMGAQLRIVMLQAKRIAEMTKAQPDLDIAGEAERAYQQHQEKQAVVDAGGGIKQP